MQNKECTEEEMNGGKENKKGNRMWAGRGGGYREGERKGMRKKRKGGRREGGEEVGGEGGRVRHNTIRHAGGGGGGSRVPKPCITGAASVEEVVGLDGVASHVVLDVHLASTSLPSGRGRKPTQSPESRSLANPPDRAEAAGMAGSEDAQPGRTGKACARLRLVEDITRNHLMVKDEEVWEGGGEREREDVDHKSWPKEE
ncbi:hypothetical protein CYMTET_31137 [Cymbomonas tetramitiformis]|uniref:Uncharacterized protein n=1 Tax=Cymbomonas tetramitiformis TaxID=36881 RepID=A0AAE0FHQ4_9CHLO|nr:hypothetical protein CYMTET_31137 [Cymbomonas tetramitiformis]